MMSLSFLWISSFFLSLFVQSSLAAPFFNPWAPHWPTHKSGSSMAACSLESAKFPSNTATNVFTKVNAQARYPEALALGVGIQNYTCTASTGKYASVGAVATLFDISCLIDTSIFPSLTLLGNDLTSLSLLATTPVQEYSTGHHYFVEYEGTLSPRFDWSKDKNVPESEYFIGKKLANGASPTGTQNVDWLQLGIVHGELASTVYRLYTAGGQPPASCTPGSADISVPYAAQYWFYKA